MKRVVIESPLAGDFRQNVRYARFCGLDCIRRGEAPYASHLMLTQFLDDASPEDRKIGMEAGFAWGEVGELVVVYQDLGISSGMQAGMQRALERGLPIEYRNLPSDLMTQFNAGLSVARTQGVKLSGEGW